MDALHAKMSELQAESQFSCQHLNPKPESMPCCALTAGTDDRIKAAEGIEKEYSEKQRLHHTEIKALKNEIESQNSRLRMSEADLAKVTDKLKKREVEVILRFVCTDQVSKCNICFMLFACEKLWKRCPTSSRKT
jgi:hypothetical protein